MSANRAINTGPELALRRALRADGLVGYRLHRRDLPGRPDVAFAASRVAVLIHGCYWHRCPHCRLPLPKTHTTFWKDKFNRNRVRDRRVRWMLEKDGWRVLTVWECEVRKDASTTARRVGALVERGR